MQTSQEVEEDNDNGKGEQWINWARLEEKEEEQLYSSEEERDFNDERHQIFEIRDFSVASQWERLIHEMEEAMKVIKQKKHLYELSNEQEYFLQKELLTTHPFDKYELNYFLIEKNVANIHKKEMNMDESDSNRSVLSEILLNDAFDFPHRAHHLTRWFQCKEMFIVSLKRNNNSKNNEDEKFFEHIQNLSTDFLIKENNAGNVHAKVETVDEKMLLSALLIVSQRNQFYVPCFISTNSHLLEYSGIWVYSDPNRSSSELVKLRSELLKQNQTIPPSYTKVNGLYDLFCLRLGSHFTPSLVTLSARYTFILPSEQEWHLINSKQRIRMGTTSDPIEALHIACRFKLINNSEANNIQMLESLPVNSAKIWECKCIYQTDKQLTLIANKLRSLVKNIYMPSLKESSENASSEKKVVDAHIIEEVLDQVFDEINGNDVLKSTRSKKDHLPKAFPPNHLLGRLAREMLLRFDNWSQVKLLWYIFVNVLRKYWEWAEKETDNEPIADESYVIPHCCNSIDWTNGLLVQKLDLLNICCMAEVRKGQSTKNKETELISEDEEHAWGENIIPINSESNRKSTSKDNEILDILTIYDPKENTRKVINIPVTQPEPPKTEDMITEQQIFLSNISDANQRAKYQCASLLSDMQAFKHVNRNNEQPVTFKDFLYWYSPRDVSEEGDISERMNANNNLWLQTWNSAKPIAIRDQKPLFDHKREAEKICHELETMPINNWIHQMVQFAFIWAYDCICELMAEFCSEEKVPKAITHAMHALKRDLQDFLVTTTDDNVSQERLVKLIYNYYQLEWLVSVYASLEYRFVNEKYTDTERTLIEQLCMHGFITDISDDRKDILKSLATRTSAIAKEYIFRTSAPRPFSTSDKTPQLMYILHKKDEFRICEALTESIPY